MPNLLITADRNPRERGLRPLNSCRLAAREGVQLELPSTNYSWMSVFEKMSLEGILHICDRSAVPFFLSTSRIMA